MRLLTCVEQHAGRVQLERVVRLGCEASSRAPAAPMTALRMDDSSADIESGAAVVASERAPWRAVAVDGTVMVEFFGVEVVTVLHSCCINADATM